MQERENFGDTTTFSSTKSRVAQVIYVVGALAGALFAFASLAAVYIAAFDDYTGGASEAAIINGILAPISYSVGWAVRWMMDGTSTSIFDGLLGRK